MFSKRPNGETSNGSSTTDIQTVTTVLSDRRGPRVASLITDDMTIEGNLSGDGELQIDGFVRGDVKIARLTIGEHGRVEGTVTAEILECRGKIVGAVIAQDVHLYASAHVDGDITHDELTIEGGAFFQGRAIRLQRNTVQAPVVLEEVRNAQG